MDDIKHLHSTLLILMDEIDRVCEKNKIDYTLTGGSMLGAVRHKGFIPWDDDMDIALTRENYDKLLACEKNFGEKYFLQTNKSDPNFYYGYAKSLLNETVTVEYGHENTKYKKGIFIDIFPLDNVPEKKILRNKQKKINYIIQKILRQKMSIKDNSSWRIRQKILAKILKMISSFFSGSRLMDIIDKNMKIVQFENVNYITNLCGMYGYEKESANKEWFKEYEKIQFEDRKYSVIKERDKYLTKIYGDYMKLPPMEKRHTHEFQILDFGEY